MKAPDNCLRIVIAALLIMLHTNAFSQLRAIFSQSSTAGCSPLVVQFTDLSQGSPTQWYWDLGNGTITTEQNPGAIYITPGSYTIKLVVTNDNGEDSITVQNLITVYPAPVVLFTATPASGCAPLSVQFTDLSKPGTDTGKISSWSWDFGDGILSNTQNPVHVYTLSDTFTVSLTVTNSSGCTKNFQHVKYINVFGATADFSYVYVNICQAPTVVNFTNHSSSNALSYQWLFGDGGASTQINPSHTYNTSGTFPVQLIVRTDKGCADTIRKTISVEPPLPNFNLPLGLCVNDTLLFKDNSSPVPVSESWNFGDGTSDTGFVVTHAYAAPGSYQVTMTANFGSSCPPGGSTIKKVLTVTTKGSAAFTATGNVVSCTLPSTIQFNNSSTGSATYFWSFGDGSTSAATSPSHTYTQPGFFTVRLIAFNANGCGDTLAKTDFIKLGPPDITGFENLPAKGCVPLTLNFKADINSAVPITSYLWNFGDGSTSTPSTPSHTYTNIGTYNVTLIVSAGSGCSDTLTLPEAVAVGKKPNPNFTATPRDVCAHFSVQFTDLSTGMATYWHWDFGDGGTSNDQNPLHKYGDTGYFTVTLYIESNGCGATIQFVNYIHISPPIADFVYENNCIDPYTRSFTDKSIFDTSLGNISWHWDFGDPTSPVDSAITQNSSHKFSDTGTYMVTLTVTNGDCFDTKTDTVTIVRENPLFNYEPLKTNFCKFDSVKFFAYNYDTSKIVAFQWDFGDNIQSDSSLADSVAMHQYIQAGNYIPLLIATDILGCKDTISKPIRLNIFGPKAAFRTIPGACVDSLVVFQDQSVPDESHPIEKWIWNYGDTHVDTLTGPPFQHIYTKRGAFNILLVLFDTNNCTDSAKSVIEVSQPVANFSLVDSMSCRADSVVFLNSSSPPDCYSCDYHWDFGDGVTVDTLTPKHIYKDTGRFTVTLYITDKNNCKDSMMQPNVVTISDPQASFMLADSLSACPPLLIQPINNSVNYRSILWDFGDGNTSSLVNPQHYYNNTGSFLLKLTVQGYGEHCQDTISKPLALSGPAASLKYVPQDTCRPFTESLKAIGNHVVDYIWDFGDGVTQTTAIDSINHIYDLPCKFLPKLIVVDSSGCRVGAQNPDTIYVYGAKPNFNISVLPGCDSSLVAFSDSTIVSFDSLVNHTWNFGNGSTSSDFNPLHYYRSSGIYPVSLSVSTEKGCSDFYETNVPVQVYISPSVIMSHDTACFSYEVHFTAGNIIAQSGPVQWLWDFGNGDTSSLQNPVYIYDSIGEYHVMVTATSQNGCKNNLSSYVLVHPNPDVSAGADTASCYGNSDTLHATGANSYLWNSDPSLSCMNCADPVANPASSRAYYVTGTSSGCITKDTVFVRVVQPSSISVANSAEICSGGSVQLNASGMQVYNWQPSTGLNNPNIPNPVATLVSPTTITYPYKAIGSDSLGCFFDTALVSITVLPYPTFDIKGDSVVTILAGSSYHIQTENYSWGTRAFAHWQWSPSATLSCSNCPDPTASPGNTTTYKATVSNIAGCSVSDNITIQVLCKGQNLYIPNTFSPNGDGMNDVFYPRGTGLSSIKSFRVFNRWGQLVYEKTNFEPNNSSYGWNGTYNGRLQDPDVYVYVIEVICENKTVIGSKGNVTLLR